MSSLLSGLRVLELGRFVAAPWCGQMLADLGADVIKVEQPGGGDQLRYYGPWLTNEETGEQTSDSSYFISFNRGKRSITVDLSQPEGQRIVLDLVRESDIFIQNFKAGHLAKYGLDKESVEQINPAIIYLSISGFGQNGPYADRPGLDSVFQCMGGLVSITGEPDSPPTKVGLTIVDLITGFYGVISCLAALRGREVLGLGGEAIDLALMDSAISVMSNRAQDYLLTGEVPRATGSHTPRSVASGFYKCRDGWMNLQAADEAGFRTLSKVLGRIDWQDDPRFQTHTMRWEHRDVTVPALEAELAKWDVVTLVDRLTEARVVCSPIYTLDQAFQDPQVRHRKILRHYHHPAAGEVPTLASPLNFDRNPIEDYRSPPMLGQHTDEILSSIGYSDQAIARLRSGGII